MSNFERQFEPKIGAKKEEPEVEEKITQEEIKSLEKEKGKREREFEKIMAILRGPVISEEGRQEIRKRYPELLEEVIKGKPVDLEREILYKRLRELGKKLEDREEKIKRFKSELKIEKREI